MKKTYINPHTSIVAIAHRDGILTTMSGRDSEGDKILGFGGSAKSSGVTESDVKRNNNVWDDDWSK